jgi:hypothetical protein
MPFTSDEIYWELACGKLPDGHWRGWFGIRIHADALRRLGLHPNQPSATVSGPAPPLWWHAEAERSGCFDVRSQTDRAFGLCADKPSAQP